MYFHCFLALIAMGWASAENSTSIKELKLPTPRIYGISRADDGPTILWLPNEEKGDDLVLGYKVKLWQVGCVKKPKYKYIDGKQVRLKNVMPKLRDFSTLRNLTEFTVEGANNSYLMLKGIENDVPYHVTVAAYSAQAEGPPSSPFRFQSRGAYTCRDI